MGGDNKQTIRRQRQQTLSLAAIASTTEMLSHTCGDVEGCVALVDDREIPFQELLAESNVKAVITPAGTRTNESKHSHISESQCSLVTSTVVDMWVDLYTNLWFHTANVSSVGTNLKLMRSKVASLALAGKDFCVM